MAIFNLVHLYTGRPILLLQRTNGEKREIFQFENWMRLRGLGAWGIQSGPFAALWAHSVLAIFNLVHLYTGRPILITPEGYLWEKEIPMKVWTRLKATQPFQTCRWWIGRGSPTPRCLAADRRRLRRSILRGPRGRRWSRAVLRYTRPKGRCRVENHIG